MITAASIRDESGKAIREFNLGNIAAFNRIAEGLVSNVLSKDIERFMEAAQKTGVHLGVTRSSVDTGSDLFLQFHTEMLLAIGVPYGFCPSYYRDGPGSRGLYLHMLKLNQAMKIIADKAEHIDAEYSRQKPFAT